jgi:pimeloyl-ACP methyl ester carboxylesterase
MRYITVLAFLLLVAVSSTGQSLKREQFRNAEVQYGWVNNSAGQKLRTFVTKPKNAAGEVPLIFFVGWLSCDSMEYPDANTSDGFGILLRRLIDESGYATVRMDKPGVGESQGDCSNADFKSEISGWQAAFDSIVKYDFIDPGKIIVLGMSNGGGFSPMAAQGRPVRGYVSAGSWGRTWYEHMIDLERRRLLEAGKSPAEVNSSVKEFIDFYNLYLMKGFTPGQVMAQHPEWKSLWYDAPNGQYGRPAAFYQQLQELNLGELWEKVPVPVLVIRGSADNIMSRADAEAIARTVNQAHPGNARYEQIENMTHGFTVNEKFHDPVVPMILEFMKEQMR